MKHKTSELTGAQLDAAVAKAEGREFEVIDQGENPVSPRFYVRLKPSGAVWWPSTHWVQGGPIIEREGIQLAVDERAISVAAGLAKWDAVIGPYIGLMRDAGWEPVAHTDGPTPLIAAMRAYVTHKLGEEIELP